MNALSGWFTGDTGRSVGYSRWEVQGRCQYIRLTIFQCWLCKLPPYRLPSLLSLFLTFFDSFILLTFLPSFASYFWCFHAMLKLNTFSVCHAARNVNLENMISSWIEYTPYSVHLIMLHAIICSLMASQTMSCFAMPCITLPLIYIIASDLIWS